jgi:hypothetical protein
MSLYEVSYNWVNITDEFTNNVKGVYILQLLVEFLLILFYCTNLRIAIGRVATR